MLLELGGVRALELATGIRYGPHPNFWRHFMPSERRDLDFIIWDIVTDLEDARLQWPRAEPDDHDKWLLRMTVRNLTAARHSDGSLDVPLVYGAVSFIRLWHRKNSTVASDHEGLPKVTTELAPNYRLDDFKADIAAAKDAHRLIGL